MTKILELRKSPSKHYIIYLPYAGSFGEACIHPLHYLPSTYGYITVDYPTNFMEYQNDANKFAYGLSQQLQGYMNEHTILVGTSFGGYLAYKIAQIYQILSGLIINKVVLISVGSQNVLQRLQVTDFKISLPSDMKKEVYHRLEKDLACLRTLCIQEDILLKSPLYIFIGKDDHFVNETESLSYWKIRANGFFEHHLYHGKHIPSLINWQEILRLLAS